MLRDLGIAVEATGPDGRIQWRFWYYSAPAGPGKTVPAGPGTGHWKNWSVADGLPGNSVFCSLVDRDGNLWFGIQNSGASRYDGYTFTTFTTEDGLGHNTVWAIFQDRNGDLWFGTRGGATQYDGQTWKTFTTQNGLVHDSVKSIFQDRDGHLWFGTEGGVSRYDGQTFISFTTQDGLAQDHLGSIIQDRAGEASPEPSLWFGSSAIYPGPSRGVSRYMVIGLVKGDSKHLTIANAAHHAHPLRLHNGEVQPLIAKGMPLGMMAGITYREVEFPLKNGDVLVFMTDGIIEVQSPPRFIGDSAGTYYADSGLLEAAMSQFAPSLSAEAMVDVILNDAIAFGGNSAQRDDDMTVVVVKVQ